MQGIYTFHVNDAKGVIVAFLHTDEGIFKGFARKAEDNIWSPEFGTKLAMLRAKKASVKAEAKSLDDLLTSAREIVSVLEKEWVKKQTAFHDLEKEIYDHIELSKHMEMLTVVAMPEVVMPELTEEQAQALKEEYSADFPLDNVSDIKEEDFPF